MSQCFEEQIFSTYFWHIRSRNKTKCSSDLILFAIEEKNIRLLKFIFYFRFKTLNNKSFVEQCQHKFTLC